MAGNVRGAWSEFNRRPARERVLWLAFFGAILLALLGVLLALVGVVTDTYWLEILGVVALVGLGGGRGLILRAISRIYARRQTGSGR